MLPARVAAFRWADRRLPGVAPTGKKMNHGQERQQGGGKKENNKQKGETPTVISVCGSASAFSDR